MIARNARLPLDQRKLTQITTVQHQHIKRAEVRPVAAVQQRAEVGAAVVVEADDLAVEHCGVAADRVREFHFEIRPVLERVPVT